MPRDKNEPEPSRWKVFNGTQIGLDATKRRSDGEVDRRSNDTHTIVAQVLIEGDEGRKLAQRIVDACIQFDQQNKG